MLVTIDQANAYFATRLDTSVWDDAIDDDKNKSLIMATNIINNLQFLGTKVDPLQPDEFPRVIPDLELDGSTTPYDITIAICEIVLTLLDGIDINKEINNLSLISRSYVSTRVHYDRAVYPDYFMHGVTSANAWNYLIKYLDKSKITPIRLSRV